MPVDLRCVNLDKSIKLSWRCVEVYPDDDDGITLILEKPDEGEKLNNSAIITFFKFQVKDE